MLHATGRLAGVGRADGPRRTPRATLGAVAIAASVARIALAGSPPAEWIGLDGIWFDNRNWSTGLVPRVDETALFADGFDEVLIRLDTDYSVGRIVVSETLLTLRIAAFSPELLARVVGAGPDPSLVVAAPGTAILELVVFGEPELFTVRDASVGLHGTGMGLMSGSIAVQETLVIGDGDTGTFRHGNVVAGQLDIGRDGVGMMTPINESVPVTIDCDGPIRVGVTGPGLLAANANLTAGSIDVAFGPGTIGDVAFGPPTGSNPITAAITGDLRIGKAGYGQLTVTEAGVTVGGDLILGEEFDTQVPLFTGHGRLVVRGEGAHISVAGDALIGVLGSGNLVVSNEASISVGGDLMTFDFPIAGPADALHFELPVLGNGDPAIIEVAGHAAPPPIVVSVPDVQDIPLYSSWCLLEASTIDTPAIALPDLPSGRAWTVDVTDGRLTVRVDPVLPPGPDLNLDGVVDLLDLLALLETWGPCAPPPLPCIADIDADGTVGIIDLLLMLIEWD